MRWSGWVILLLVLLNAGWMTYDGSRALITGEYVTPESGRFAGQLGPWSKVVRAVGIEPRSTLMKCIFVVYGVAFLATTVMFLMQKSWARTALIIMAVLGLWHIPFGTVINIVILVLVWFARPAPVAVAS